jgi:hypothetical protein
MCNVSCILDRIAVKKHQIGYLASLQAAVISVDTKDSSGIERY